MEKIFIENEYLKVGIKLFGAELTSVVSKKNRYGIHVSTRWDSLE